MLVIIGNLSAFSFTAVKEFPPATRHFPQPLRPSPRLPALPNRAAFASYAAFTPHQHRGVTRSIAGSAGLTLSPSGRSCAMTGGKTYSTGNSRPNRFLLCRFRNGADPGVCTTVGVEDWGVAPFHVHGPWDVSQLAALHSHRYCQGSTIPGFPFPSHRPRADFPP